MESSYFTENEWLILIKKYLELNRNRTVNHFLEGNWPI